MRSSRAHVDGCWPTRQDADAARPVSALPWMTVFGLLVLVVSLASRASAQPLPNPRILPSQQPLPMPAPQAAERPPSVLPPAPLPGEGTESVLDRGLAIEVDVVEILGNTVLPSESLEEIASQYLGRMLVNEDLLDLQRRITRLYVEAGYATSFAMLPDQDLAGGLLRVRVVEGKVARVDITGNASFSRRYIEQRVLPDPDAPLNVRQLERRLQVLQLDPRIAAVQARLSASPRPGFAVLALEVVEISRWRGQAAVTNDLPPAIGATNLRAGVGASNLIGWGDDIAMTGVVSEGLWEIVVDASIPINRHDTTLGTRLRYSDSEVIDPLFADLDIRGSFWSVGLALAQPLIRSPGLEWEASVIGELRQSRSTLGGIAFPTTEASLDGQLRVAVFRFATDVAYRDAVQVIAARTMLSVGAPILGASESVSGSDDSDFVSWLGQVQWARRFSAHRIELFTRFDWQLAWDPLPPFERFAVGGLRTVRGYTENRLVRDNGLTGSIELRVPVLSSADGRPIVAIAPFVDAGRAWFRERGPTPDPKNLVGAGVGMLWNPRPWMSTYFYWGAQLIPVQETQSTLQSDGIYFGITFSKF